MEDTIRIQEIIDSLKNKWQMIVGIALVATIISTVVSFFLIKPKYEASTKLFIGKEVGDTVQNNYSSSDVTMYQNLLKTYVDVIKTNDLVNNAIKDTDIEASSKEILSNLSVEAVASTQILKISYVNTDKKEAKDVVDAIANKFIEKSTELISNANVQIIESVRMPERPVSPNKKLNIAVAFVLGLMIGVGLALILEFMDNTFKDKSQIEKMLELPVIGTIPNEEL